MNISATAWAPAHHGWIRWKSGKGDSPLFWSGIALANGTLALELALMALGVGEGDEVVVTPRTRAVIAVHLAGWPCDMRGLRALADEHGLRLIEDCAQAHGATFDGRQVGSFGDVAAVQAEGVPCMHGGCSEIYRERAFDGTDFRPPERLPVARELGETSLMFPVDHTLSETDMHTVADAVERVMRTAAR